MALPYCCGIYIGLFLTLQLILSSILDVNNCIQALSLTYPYIYNGIYYLIAALRSNYIKTLPCFANSFLTQYITVSNKCCLEYVYTTPTSNFPLQRMARISCPRVLHVHFGCLVEIGLSSYFLKIYNRYKPFSGATRGNRLPSTIYLTTISHIYYFVEALHEKCSSDHRLT